MNRQPPTLIILPSGESFGAFTLAPKEYLEKFRRAYPNGAAQVDEARPNVVRITRLET